MTVSSPSSWDLVLVPAALDSERPIIRPKAKIAARDYRLSGRYPIIDQSQNDIAGWTNSEDAVLPVTRPVIVFGDHSRTFKYVDHAFAAGADGTLILNPAKEFDPRFLYFACVGLEIPNRGYNRHYSLLKEMSVPRPPPAEQRAIADILSKVQEAIETEGQLVRVTRELKQAALRQLFTRGLRGEPQKETEIGPVPESWDLVPLSKAALLERGRFTHRPRNEPRFYGGNTPFVQTGDVVRSGGWVNNHTQTLNEEGVAISRVFPKGTILITIAANIGYSGILQFDSAAPDSLVGVTPSTDFDAAFLNYFLQTQRRRMDELAPRGTQKNINIQFLSPWLTPKPSFSEQREIAALLGTIDAKLAHHEARQKLLRELFRTVLHDLMTARRRVKTSGSFSTEEEKP